jgi:fucose 4-O-acetylase-like acetyltransferase
LYDFIAKGEFKITLFVDGGLPWFMLAMFAFPIITYLVRKAKFPVVLIMSIIVSLAVGYFRAVGNVFSISRIIVYFPFFYAGYAADAKMLKYVCDKLWVKVLSAVVLIALAVVCFGFVDEIVFLRPLLTGKHSYYMVEEHFDYAFALRLLCYVVSAIAGFSVVALTPNHTKMPAFRVLGSRTLSVYVYHYILLYILFNHLHFKEALAEILPWWALVVMLPLSFAITVLLSLNVFYKPLEYMMGLPSTIKQKIKARS